MAENEGLPLAARIRIDGETSAQSELLADPERWINELRSAALATGSGSVWVEKIGFATTLPPSLRSPGRPAGALAELVNLFDQLAADPGARSQLAAELTDLEKKIPRELRGEPDGLRFDDADWLGDLLRQVQPMLLQRLLRKEEPE
jgi:exonuclease SbcD